MREELVRRNYAQTTIRTYLRAIEEFHRYQAALLEEKKLAAGTVALRISALRVLYLKVLRKRALKDELPYPKNSCGHDGYPILTPDEMTLLIMYCCGLRRSELWRWMRPKTYLVPGIEAEAKHRGQVRLSHKGGR